MLYNWIEMERSTKHLLVTVEFMQYLLTFTLAMSAHNCSSAATLIVSAPDTSAEFSMKDKYGKETWENYGYQLGSWGLG